MDVVRGDQGNKVVDQEIATFGKNGYTLEGVAGREQLSGVKFLQSEENPGDLTIVLPDGTTVVIPNYLVFAQAGLPPNITLADGSVIPGQDILDLVPDLNLDEIAPAAGIDGPIGPGSGAAFTDYSTPNIGDDLNHGPYAGNQVSLPFTADNGDASNKPITEDVDTSFTDGSESIITQEDSSISGNVIDGTSDYGAIEVTQFIVGGTTYSAGGTANLSEGDLTINSDGSYSFTPDADYNGSVPKVTYTLSNGASVVTSTLDIEVTPVVDIVADSITTAEETAITYNVLANDTFENAGRVISSVTDGSNGTVTIVDAAAGTVQYTPATDFFGSDSFTYTVTSGGVTETVTVNVNVTNSEDESDIGGETSGSGAEDGGTITGTLTATDPDGLTDGSYFTVTGAASNGTATIDAASGAWSYTPIADYNGSDSFIVTVTDDEGGTTTQVIDIEVTPVVDIVADSITTAEETAITYNVLANDTFENAGRVISSVTDGSNGTVTIVDAAAGTVQYTPATDFFGSDSFTYTVTSGGVTETVTVNVNVTNSEDESDIGGETSGSGAEDGGTITGTLTATDPDGLTDGSYFTVTGAASNGTATIDAASGAWSYTPIADYNGSDSFIVTVTDDEGGTTTQVIDIEVTPVVDIVADSITTAEETAITYNVLANDTFENAGRVISSVTDGSNGTVTIVDAAAGTVQYTPATDFFGSDSFTYTVTSGGVTETVTVNVNVTNSEDESDIGGETSGSGAEDGGTITGTLTATDPDGLTDGSYFTVTGAASNGTATIDVASGAWSYTPIADYNGSDSFIVTVTDDEGGTTTQVIDIEVTPVVDIVADSITTAEETAITYNVLANDTFENAGRVISSVTDGSNGTVTIVDAAAGTVQYTPATDFFGSDSFTYTVTSGGVTETVTVNVNVTNSEDESDIGGETSGSGAEDGGTITGTLTATDPDGLTDGSYFTVTGAASNGTATIDAASGAWSYTPIADYNGSDSFIVTVTDDEGGTTTQVIDIEVTPVVDIVADSITTAEETAITYNVLANDTFENAGRVISSVTDGSNGTVTIVDAAAGTVQYTPATDFFGSDSFTYTVTSGGVTETVTVNVNVTNSEDESDIGGETSGSGAEDGGTITGTLTATDPDGLTDGSYFTVTGAASNGTATIDAASGAWSYTPIADYNGSDSFIVTVTDDEGGTTTQVIDIEVTPVVDIVADSITTAEETAITYNVLANDTFENAGRVISSVTDGSNGTVTIVDAAAGTVQYTPATDFFGSDSFTYTVTSGGVTETVTVNVNVTNSEDESDIGGETSGSGAEDGGTITGTLTATDPDGLTDGSYFTVTGAASNGTATIDAASGAWSYTPIADYNGSDSFIVTVTDDEGGTTTQVIDIEVTPVVDIVADSITTAEETAITYNVLANDTFENAGRVISSVTDGSNGTVTIVDAAAGTVQYTPATDFFGSDSFTYTVTSGGVTETVTVNVNVTNSEDESDIGGETSGSGAEDGGTITGTLTATDPDGLTDGSYFTVTGAASNGTATIDAASGAWSYTPIADYNGSDSFIVTVTDDEGGTTTQVIDIEVTPVVDIVADSITTAEETAITYNVLANDTFENAGRVISSVTDGSNGTVTIVDAAAGTVQYTPATDFFGSDSFTYTVTSGGVTETVTVNVNVTNSEDESDIGGETSGSGAEDGGTITGTLTATDPDGLTDGSYFTVTGAASNGTATIDVASGAWSYTPIADYNGSDSFIVTVTDDEGGTTTQVIDIEVTPVVDIVADSITTAEETAITYNVLANDTFENAGRVISSVTDGSNGTVTIVDAAAGTVQYTPATDFFGSDSFTYTVTSGGVTETVTVNVNVTNSEDESDIGGETSGSGAEDGGTITGTLTATDPDGLTDGSYFTVTGAASNGTATIDAASGAWSYTPIADYNGSDSFIVTVTDDEGGTTTQVIDIEVTPVVDIVADSITTAEETAITYNVLANDTFENAGRVISSVTDGSNGTVTIVDAAAGTVQYTPATDFFGSDSFTYTVTSGGVTETVTVNVNVTNSEDESDIGGETSGSGAEDGGTITGTLTATDPDGLTDGSYFTVTGAASNGTATIDVASGAWSYTPIADYNGSDSFIVTVTDDEGGTTTQVIDIEVTPVVDIVADSITTAEETAITYNVLANDTFENAGRVISSVTDGSNGTVTIVDAAAGTVQYTPATDFFGSDSFTYTVTSGGVTETVTVNVNVTNSEDESDIGGETSGSGAEDGGTITGTLTATDPDGLTDGSYFTVTGAASNGTATIDVASGAWSYTPIADYNGSDSFIVTVTDDEGGTTTQVIDIEVTPVVDIVADSITTAEETAITYNVLANDTFENAGRVISSVTDGSNGTVTIVDAAAGTVQYTPATDFFGSDSFTYTVTSGGVTETVTVNVNVTNSEDESDIGGETSGSGAEDGGTITGTLTATDPDGLTDGSYFTVTGAASNGTATIDAASGAWSYTPIADYNGSDSFIVTVTDDEGGTTTQVIDIEVTPVVDIVADSITTAEETAITYNVLANDTFENAGRVISSVTDGSNGTVTIVDAAAGTVQYTPATDFFGSDSFTYTVTSGGVTETVTVNVNVTSVNDAPIISDSSVTVSEEGLLVSAGAPYDGVPDTTGNNDTTDNVVQSGSFVISDPDGGIDTVTLSVPTTTLTSNSVTIEWAGDGTSTLVGTAGSQVVATVTIDITGAYEVTLSGPIDHPTKGVEDELSFDIGVTATDDGGLSSTGTLTVTVEDDMPTAQVEEQVLQVEPVDTNLMIILDISTSMRNDSGVNDPHNPGDYSRLDLAKLSIINLLDGYDHYGDIKVRIITFDTEAQAYGSDWMTIDDAKAAINGLDYDGRTNYDAALDTAMTAFHDGVKIPDGQNISYFLSDGDPNEGDSVGGEWIDSSEELAWIEFLEENDINSISLAMDDGVSIDGELYLDRIAYDGITENNTNHIMVDDMALLDTTLQSTITIPPLMGSILDGSITAQETSFGADGGHVYSISIDGTRYEYNPTGNGSITADGPNLDWSFDTVTNTLTIVSSTEGILAVDMDDGSYSYWAPASISGIYPEYLEFELVDNDGDLSGTGQLTMNVHPAYDAVSDIVLTNIVDGSPIDIPASALVHNDLLGDGGDLIDVSNIFFGTVSGTDPVIFDPETVFGSSYSTENETSYSDNDGSGQGSTVAQNNSWNSAIDLTDRSLFGPVPNNNGDYSDVGDAALPSFKFVGNINDPETSGNTFDNDYIKVRLRAGEMIILDVDYGIGGLSDVDTMVYLYDTDGTTVLASNDDDSVSLGGDGSTSIYDSYLTHTVSADGDYYVGVTHYTDGDSGDYVLWISIDDSSTTSLGSFDYTISDGSQSESATANIIAVNSDTITGTEAGEILVGGSGDDTLLGGGGNDSLVGHGGDDTLTGGLGDDLFIFTAASDGDDIITDFSVDIDGDGIAEFGTDGLGNDVINLDALFDDLGIIAADRVVNAESSGSDTILHVGSDNGGGFVELTGFSITLSGVDLNNAEVQTLIAQGNIVADES